MVTVPPFRYFLSDRKTEVAPDSVAWRGFLPTCRASAFDGTQCNEETGTTRGDYFEAVRAFLLDPPHHRLVDAVSCRIRRPVPDVALDFIDICLEKHGQFYHPARVVTAAGGPELSFVVNAAVTAPGMEIIEADFRNIRRINRQFPYRFLPRVYHLGEVRDDTVRPKWRLFLGQWLENYHEFHLHRLRPDGAVRMFLWDPARGSTKLSATQTAEVYRLAARILTATYSVTTGEQIGAWHHAAGDFVLRIIPSIDLKLVTARQYRPLFGELNHDAEMVFQALLLFLLNLSVRMRIDRDHGTGDLLWAEEPAVAATVDGFFEGLDLQIRHGLIPSELPALFRAYTKELNAAALADLLVALERKSHTAGEASDLIHRHLEAHARTMRSVL